ncbi:MAG: signal transduction histidine kinase/tetratricopeptide (TPR) repeat protein [Paraglaciecola sp.]|jgi:signal transduction histidine kinase/tetratricopeptide (TPR) repeat protein
MHIRLVMIFCHCILFTLPILANPIDSLLEILPTILDPEKKIDILLSLSSFSTYDDHLKQFDYANQAYEIFHKNQIANDSLLAEVLYYLGSANESINQNKVALQLFDQSANISKKLALDNLDFYIFNNKGIVYDKIGYFDLAIENYQKALKIAETKQDADKIGIAANNIAIIYTTLKDYDKAQELLQKSYAVSVEVGDEYGTAITLCNMGDVSFDQKNWDEATSYFSQALHIVDSLDINYGIAHANLYLGLTLQMKGQLELAKQHCLKAYEVAETYSFAEPLGRAALGLAELKLAKGEYLNSIVKAKEALNLIQKMNSKEVTAKVYKCLSENYEAIGDFAKALTYRQQYEIEQDSLFDEERIANFSALEYRFNTKKKDAENSLLKAKQLRNEATIKQQSIIAWAIGSILLLFGLSTWVLFFQNKQKQRYNKKLKKEVAERTQHLQASNEKLSTANQELEQFAYITSHDLKEPLRNISGFSSLIQRNIKQEKYENLDEYLGFISQNTRQMHALIEDILAYSKVGNSKEMGKTTSLALIIENAKNDLHLLMEEKKGQIIYTNPTLVHKSASILLPFQVSMIFKNLIENGLKYNRHAKPIIKITHAIKNNFHVFNFRDNGIGINKEYHKKVFEMFKRLHHRGEYNGSGVGLAICKKVVQNLKGQLKIVQSDETGTNFVLKIPIHHK